MKSPYVPCPAFPNLQSYITKTLKSDYISISIHIYNVKTKKSKHRTTCILTLISFATAELTLDESE